ncbi:MAG: hypothetical protein ACQERZ_07185 [Fusobacteriota bacterium]
MSIITLNLNLEKIQKLINEWDENYQKEFEKRYKEEFEEEVDKFVKDLLTEKYLEKIKCKTGVSLRCAQNAMETVLMFITKEDVGTKYSVEVDNEKYIAEVVSEDKIIIWDGDRELKLNENTKKVYYDISEKLEIILIKSFRSR